MSENDTATDGGETATSGGEAATDAIELNVQGDAGSLFGAPAFRWTILRHFAAFLLLNVCSTLTLLLVPDVLSLVGVAEMLAETEQYVPGALTALLNFTKMGVGLFTVLFWLGGGPILGALLGISSAVREREASRLTVSLASGVGSYLGFVLPFTVALVLAATLSPWAGAGNVLGAIVGGVLFAIPTGLSAAGMAFLSSPK